jgi:hypothetical protein
MNLNVIVVNMFHDLRPADIADRVRDRGEQFARSFSNPDTTAAEQVIELKPENGAWVEKGGTTASQQTFTHSLAHEARALHASPTATTYGHDGRAHFSAQDKGLRINITA